MSSKRRGAGEGSIFPRKDSEGKIIGYTITVEMGTIGGARKRKAKQVKTLREAKQHLAAMLAAKHEGELKLDERLTVSAWLDMWLEEIKVRPGTRRFYEIVVTLYLRPQLGHIQLRKLTSQHIVLLLREVEQVSESRAERVFTILRGLLNLAVRRDLIAINPCTKVDSPAAARREDTVFWSPEEASRFLTDVAGKPYEMVFVTALMLGLRRGEVLGLKWGDIDWPARTITISRQVVVEKNRIAITPPKNSESAASLMLPTMLAERLRQHRVKQLELRLMMGQAWGDQDFVFCNQEGEPLHPNTIYLAFQRALKQMGYPHMRFHDLRHACASLLFAQGVSMDQISKYLRHASPDITNKLYVHFRATFHEQAANTMDQIMGAESSFRKNG